MNLNAVELRLVDGGVTLVLVRNIGALTPLGGPSVPSRTRVDLRSGGHVFVKETAADVASTAGINVLTPGE